MINRLRFVPTLLLLLSGCYASTGKDDSGTFIDQSADDDGDGLTNYEEEALGTDPSSVDSDGDGTQDGDEVAQGFDPLDADDKPYLGGYPVARCDSLPAATGNAVGDVTDDFTLTDQNGEQVYLQDFCNSVVILEASNFG